MATIKTAIALYDGVTAPLQAMHKAMNIILNSFEAVQQASGNSIDVSSIREAREELAKAGAAFDSIEQNIRDAGNQQDKFNQKIKNGSAATDSLWNKLKGIASTMGVIALVKKGLDISDQLSNTNARLNNAIIKFDDGGSLDGLEKKVMASAQRSRTFYMDSASSIAKLALNARDAFESMDEVIAFQELINKQFIVGGASVQEQQAAMLQLTQAMASGILRGEELNSVFEQAPGIVQSIANYLGVPIGEIRTMAAEGQITSNIVKNAMFAAADDIEAKFSNMPKTWGQIWISMKNRALSVFSPILEKINQIANSEKFEKITDNIITALAGIASVATAVLDLLIDISSVVMDNWSWIAPVIMGIVGALLIYKTVLFIITAIEAISAVGKGILAAATALQTGATFGATAAQYGLNTAMWACPITWIIALILLLIVAFIALWENCEGFRDFWADMWEKNANLAGDIYNNVLQPVFNALCDAQIWAAQTGGNAAKKMVNIWHTAASGIVSAISSILDKVGFLVDAYNSIMDVFGGPKINLNFLENVQKGLDETRDKYINAIDSYIETATTGALNNKLDKWDLDVWHEYTSNMSDQIRNFTISGWLSDKWDEISEGLNGLGDDYKDESPFEPEPQDESPFEPEPQDDVFNNIYENTDDTAENTAAMMDALDIAEEDLAYMRDIAERKAINRFTTAEIRVEQQNTNYISKDTDLDGVMDVWANEFATKLDVSEEGVHA